MASTTFRAIAWMLLCLGTAATFAADGAKVDANAVLKSMRDAMGIPADTVVEYRGEKGAVMSADAFATQMMQPGLSALIDKSQPGKVILKLQRIAPKAPETGPARLPAMDLIDLARRRVRNADLAGKPSLLSFYFSTCMPCIKEVPALNAYAKAHPELNYLAVTFDSVDEARKFVATHALSWRVAASARSFIDAAGVHGYPTYLLVAADGRIIGRQSGLAFDGREKIPGMAGLEKFVAPLLAHAKP